MSTLSLTRRHIARGPAPILLTMSLGVLIAQIDTSVANLAVAQIGARLDAGVGALQWVVDAYNLVYASLLLTAGMLADLFGRRRIFALGIALFTFGSRRHRRIDRRRGRLRLHPPHLAAPGNETMTLLKVIPDIEQFGRP